MDTYLAFIRRASGMSYYRLMADEPNGLSHVLTTWRPVKNEREARRIAKQEKMPFREITVTT